MIKMVLNDPYLNKNDLMVQNNRYSDQNDQVALLGTLIFDQK